jgi:hypothetical protein
VQEEGEEDEVVEDEGEDEDEEEYEDIARKNSPRR